MVAALIPDSKFSTEMFEPKEQRNAWIESAKSMHDVSPIDQGNTDFNGSVETWNVDDICFASVEFDAQIIEHLKGKHNISGDQNYLFAAIYREGFARALHSAANCQFLLLLFNLHIPSIEGGKKCPLLSHIPSSARK